MSAVKYEVVEHDGGWAYRVDGVYSETYGSHDAAARAAHLAAVKQGRPGEDAGIVYEDAQGRWHSELASGDDRPRTEVDD